MRGSLQMLPGPPADRYVVSVIISVFQTKLECISAAYGDCTKEFVSVRLLVLETVGAICWACGARRGEFDRRYII